MIYKKMSGNGNQKMCFGTMFFFPSPFVFFKAKQYLNSGIIDILSWQVVCKV